MTLIEVECVDGTTLKVKAGSEEELHIKLIKALRDKYPQYIIFGSTTNFHAKSKIKKIKPYGCVRGLPDVIMFAPSIDKNGNVIYTMLCLELKRPTGGRISTEQREVLNKLAVTGRAYTVFVRDANNNVDGIMELVATYLDPEKHHLLKDMEIKPVVARKPRITKPRSSVPIKNIKTKRYAGIKKPNKSKKIKKGC